MKKPSLALLLLFSLSPCFGQKKDLGDKILDNLFFTRNQTTYLYLQARYSREYSMNSYGIQLKRTYNDGEDPVAGFQNDQEFSVGFAQRGDNKFISTDVNAGIWVFPFTLIFTLGAGINYTASVNYPDKVLSLYPKISLSVASVSIYYSYKTPVSGNLDFNYSPHGLTIAFGPRIWHK